MRSCRESLLAPETSTAAGNSPGLAESQQSLKQWKKASFAGLVPSQKSSQLALGEENLLAEALFLPQTIHLGNTLGSPIDNVRRVLEHASSETSQRETHQLFCEMLYLSNELDPEEEEYEEVAIADENSTFVWQQTARWIKYEQVVEGDGTRFSKPHITLLTVHSLLQVKNCLRKGVVLLNNQASSFIGLCDQAINSWLENGLLNAKEEEQINLVKEILYAPKLHLIHNRLRKINEMISEEKFKKRRDSQISTNGSIKSIPFTRNYSLHPDDSDSDENSTRYEDADERLLNRLPPDTNAAVILVAKVNGLTRTLSCFIRLEHPTLLYPELPDHPIPIKFVYILLSPSDNYLNETTGIGRAMGALFTDEIFQRVIYSATERHTITDAVEEFFSQLVAIPPGKCNPEARWQPKETEDKERSVGMLYADYDPYDDFFEDDDVFEKENCGVRMLNIHQPAIFRTGRCFGGLIQDFKRKSRWYYSDFEDYFQGRLSQSLAATISIFFANISNIITFGAVMERALHHQMAAIENIICGGLCGIIFGLFSGQPLNILSATGPTLVFEKILYDFCTAYQWEFLPFRFYVGIWMAFFLLILVATDASALVGLITRFTEEAFAALISVVFIIQAFEKLYEISYEAPITRRPEEILKSTCYCLIESDHFSSNGTLTPITKNMSIGVSRCRELGGIPQGKRCFFKPDVYMFSILLTFGTFIIAFVISNFRHSPYLTHKIRSLISDFGMLVAIVLMTILTHLIGLEVPSLKVPSRLRPTLERDWIVDVTAIAGPQVIAIAILPALFYTILIVMDQQITAVIVNRKDNKLKKGSGYHLDLLVVMVLVVMCSLLGLPYYVAATVLSVTHLDALKLQSDSWSTPGEKPKFLGIKEQRLTTIFAHVLIGCSLFLTPLVKLVPLPVLTGIFLYMGVVSLLGQQFVQRVGLLFMSVKYQPDYSWLRTVRMSRVHLFTVIQVLSMIGLFAIKYASTISMVFPMMLIVMVIIRMQVLGRIFNKKELMALDDILPTFNDVWRPKVSGISRQSSFRLRVSSARLDSTNHPVDGHLLKELENGDGEKLKYMDKNSDSNHSSNDNIEIVNNLNKI